MAKDLPKSDQVKKQEIIKLFAEALDKNTRSQHEVWTIIHVLQDVCYFMDNKRYQYDTDLASSVRFIRNTLQEAKSPQIELYDEMTDDILELIMIAGANAEGSVLVNSIPMRDDLHAITNEFCF